jgi:ferritin
MFSQAQEEVSHAHRFYKYVYDRGGRVTLLPIDGPGTEWESPLAVFEEAYAHEVKVSDRINKLVDLSLKLSDHATNNFLQWFVGEQVEEEASVDEVVQRLKLIKDSADGLFMLDIELGKRPLMATLPAGEGQA